MSIMDQLLSASEARSKLTKIVREVNETGIERIIINNNKPVAVLMTMERYKELLEKEKRIGE